MLNISDMGIDEVKRILDGSRGYVRAQNPWKVKVPLSPSASCGASRLANSTTPAVAALADPAPTAPLHTCITKKYPRRVSIRINRIPTFVSISACSLAYHTLRVTSHAHHQTTHIRLQLPAVCQGRG